MKVTVEKYRIACDCGGYLWAEHKPVGKPYIENYAKKQDTEMYGVICGSCRKKYPIKDYDKLRESLDS